MLLEFTHFLVDKVKNDKIFSDWKFSTEEPLAVHILRVNGINANRSAIKVVR